MITDACRVVDGGDWIKDLLYVIGVVKQKKLKRLWLIDGGLDLGCVKAGFTNIKNLVIVLVFVRICRTVKSV